MNKHVLSASLRLDEAVAFGGIEPLYISYRHFDASRTVDDVLTQAARFRRIVQGKKMLSSGVVASHQRTAVIQPDGRRLLQFSVSARRAGRPRIWLDFVCRSRKGPFDVSLVQLGQTESNAFGLGQDTRRSILRSMSCTPRAGAGRARGRNARHRARPGFGSSARP